MDIQVNDLPADTVSVIIRPTDDDGRAWGMLNAITDYCWANYGVDLDHDAIVVTFVYAPAAEEGAERLPEAAES